MHWSQECRVQSNIQVPLINRNGNKGDFNRKHTGWTSCFLFTYICSIMCSLDNIHIKDGAYLYTLIPYWTTEEEGKVKKERSMNVPLLRECGVNIQNECLTHEQYSSSTVKCKNMQFPWILLLIDYGIHWLCSTEWWSRKCGPIWCQWAKCKHHTYLMFRDPLSVVLKRGCT